MNANLYLVSGSPDSSTAHTTSPLSSAPIPPKIPFILHHKSLVDAFLEFNPCPCLLCSILFYTVSIIHILNGMLFHNVQSSGFSLRLGEKIILSLPFHDRRADNDWVLHGSKYSFSHWALQSLLLKVCCRPATRLSLGETSEKQFLRHQNLHLCRPSVVFDCLLVI